jgi:hypothetical protein
VLTILDEGAIVIYYRLEWVLFLFVLCLWKTECKMREYKKKGLMGVHKSLFHNRLESGETVPRNRAVLALIMTVVFCGLLSVSGCTQGHTYQMETETFVLTVWPAKVYANVGEQIEICCTVDCLINTPVEISCVYVVLFDSHDSMIREQAMTMDSYWSASTEYTVAGDEAYFKIKVNFTYPLGPSGNYSECGAHSFPIVVSQE